MKSTQWAAIFHALSGEERMNYKAVHFVALHVFTFLTLLSSLLTPVGESSSNTVVYAPGQKCPTVDK